MNIDAEKLIAEIERWRDKAKEKYNESTYSMGRCDALAEFRNYIVSLQQEQPERPEIAEYYYHKGLYEGLCKGRADAFKMLEELMKRKADPVIVIKQQEQPDFPTTDEQIKEFLATHPEIKVPEKYKNPDWLFKKQEQSEVFDTVAFQRGVQEGRRLEREDVLTIADIELLHAFLYAVKNNKHGAFTFTRLTDEQYEEILRRFNKVKE